MPVNIALNKPTYQHYPLSPGDALFEAGNAVDGRRSDLSWDGGQCAVSDYYKQTATWWVNLTNIQSIHPDAIVIAHKVTDACRAMKDLMVELPNYRKSKTLRELVIQINTIESEADELYINAMRNLHVNGKDPLEVIAWRDVYAFLEYCADCCENVADVVDSIVMKNS